MIESIVAINSLSSFSGLNSFFQSYSDKEKVLNLEAIHHFAHSRSKIDIKMVSQIEFELACLINLTDLSLVAVIGITTPGNKTVFLRGNIGKVSGIDSFDIASSSSEVIRGINSDSSSIGSNEIEFKLKMLLI